MDWLLFLTLLPSYLLGKYIYNMDKVEKEPTSLLVKLFIGGIGAILLTIILSDLAELFLPVIKTTKTDIKSLIIYNFVGVALIEEFSKWFFLLICTWKNKNFNYLFDGIVYGFFVSIGFATVENFLYVYHTDGGIYVAILRALLSVPAHAFFGVFMGYYFGLARMNKNKKKPWLWYFLVSLLLPIVLHGTFDFCLSIGTLTYTAIYILFVLSLYVLSFKKIKKLSKNDKIIV